MPHPDTQGPHHWSLPLLTNSTNVTLDDNSTLALPVTSTGHVLIQAIAGRQWTKSATPEFTLHTHILAFLCFQTTLPYCFGGNTDKLEHKLEHMVHRKFKFIVTMQRYSKFNKEHKNAEFLLCTYPELQIAYLKEEPHKAGRPWLYSALIDGHSKFNLQTGQRKPKSQLELPGDPILGEASRTTRTMPLPLQTSLPNLLPTSASLLGAPPSSQPPTVSQPCQWYV